MTKEEQYISRKLFKLKVLELDGIAFEIFFVDIMRRVNKNFRAIKPKGNIGDRKNDGFDDKRGIYYQVYAPEKPQISITKAINKCKKDFSGLKKAWDKACKIKKFNFVFNDKYKGAYPDIETTLKELEKKYKGISFSPYYCQHLEENFLGLSESDIVDIVGILPSSQNIEQIDYSILGEAINFILSNNKSYILNESYNPPDFDKKIKFNKLSKTTHNLLNVASHQLSVLDDYFDYNSQTTKKELRDCFVGLYKKAKKELSSSDEIFFYILKNSYSDNIQDKKRAEDAVLVLMANYFESCDIFEEPK